MTRAVLAILHGDTHAALNYHPLVHNYSGFLKVDGLPRFAEQNQGVKFYMKNLGLRRMPQKNQILKNFELGLSFASQFSAHKTVEGGEKHE